MLLSLIIPMYKVEKYIEKCLRSCIDDNVPDSDYEIIVINDGSPDNSMQVAAKVLEGRKNCRLLNQENAGLSVARNVGMKAASGDYIWFVDSDDWLSEGDVARMLGVLKDSKVDYVSISAHVLGKMSNKLTVSENAREVFLSKGWSHCACYYIMRRAFLAEHGLCFIQGMLHEDSVFTPMMMYYAKSCIVTNAALYNYRPDNQESITRVPNVKKNYDIVQGCSKLWEFGNNIPEAECRRRLCDVIAVMVNYSLRKILAHDKATVREYELYLRDQAFIFNALQHSSMLKYKVENLLFKLFAPHYTLVYCTLQRLMLHDIKRR